MKHEDDMTPGQYRRFKANPRNSELGHSHLCDYCERPWECPQLWHCRRTEKSTCPDCLVELQAKKDAKNTKEVQS